MTEATAKKVLNEVIADYILKNHLGVKFTEEYLTRKDIPEQTVRSMYTGHESAASVLTHEPVGLCAGLMIGPDKVFSMKYCKLVKASEINNAQSFDTLFTQDERDHLWTNAVVILIQNGIVKAVELMQQPQQQVVKPIQFTYKVS